MGADGRVDTVLHCFVGHFDLGASPGWRGDCSKARRKRPLEAGKVKQPVWVLLSSMSDGLDEHPFFWN
jgi:hypothetical protein